MSKQNIAEKSQLINDNEKKPPIPLSYSLFEYY